MLYLITICIYWQKSYDLLMKFCLLNSKNLKTINMDSKKIIEVRIKKKVISLIENNFLLHCFLIILYINISRMRYPAYSAR